MAKVKKPRGKARLKADTCIACGARCESACPVDAITMDDTEAPIINEEKMYRLYKMCKSLPGRSYLHVSD